jgi:hypothetical protein
MFNGTMTPYDELGSPSAIGTLDNRRLRAGSIVRLVLGVKLAQLAFGTNGISISRRYQTARLGAKVAIPVLFTEMLRRESHARELPLTRTQETEFVLDVACFQPADRKACSCGSDSQ